MKQLTILLLLAVGAMACNESDKTIPDPVIDPEEYTQELLDHASAVGRIKLMLNSYGNYDPQQVEVLLEEGDFTLFLHVEYNDNWTQIIKHIYNHGNIEESAEGVGIDRYSFHKEGRLSYYPGMADDPTMVYSGEQSGSWSFNASTRQLTCMDRTYKLLAIGADMWLVEWVENSSRHYRAIYWAN